MYHLPLMTFFHLVVLDTTAGQLLSTKVAFCWQLTYCLLYSQVAGTEVAIYLCSAVWATCLLIFEPCVSQKMRETAGTHQMSIWTLGKYRKSHYYCSDAKL